MGRGAPPGERADAAHPREAKLKPLNIYLRARRYLKRLMASWRTGANSPLQPTDSSSEPNAHPLWMLTRDIEAMKLDIKNFGCANSPLQPTDSSSQPNAHPLWMLTRDLEAMKLNIKNFGYELARERYSRRPHGTSGSAPVKVGLRSKATTQSDMESPWLDYWCTRLKIEPLYHRKVWELCYVLQALWERGMLAESKRGLGFGCGQEPLPSLMAAHGVRVTATDLPLEMSVERGWKTGEHAGELGKLYFPHLVPREQFDALVELLYFDMNHIPDSLESKYDFCWSICAYEHLGSIEKGLRFVKESLKTLKPGGVAVHTTEFNFLNHKDTIDNWSTVLFQRKHFEQVAAELERSGHRVEPLDFDVGDGAIDRYIDIPPYGWDLKKPGPWFDSVDQRAHLKLNVDGFACTCFGLIVIKKESGPGPAVG